MLPQNRVYFTIYLKKLALFTEEWPQRPETGIKDSFEEMEHEFLFGAFHLEKQDYLFRCSIAPSIFHWYDPESCVPFTFRLDFSGNLCKWQTTP